MVKDHVFYLMTHSTHLVTVLLRRTCGIKLERKPVAATTCPTLFD